MEEDEVQSSSCASARGLEKIILGSDLSILGTVSTYFTEQEDPTQDQDLSPKHHRHSTDSPLLIAGVEEGEEENVYSADISELSDTDQSESKSTRSSCDKARSAMCEKCCGNTFGPTSGSVGGNVNGMGVTRPGSICGCSAVSSHRPALRAKNLSNSNTANSNEAAPLTPAAVATTAALLKSNSSLFHASHECLSPKSPKSPKSGGLGDPLTGRLALPPFGSSNANLSVLTNPSLLCGPVAAPSVGERSAEQASGSENIMSPPPPVVQVNSLSQKNIMSPPPPVVQVNSLSQKISCLHHHQLFR